jgi:hypothetical protein
MTINQLAAGLGWRSPYGDLVGIGTHEIASSPAPSGTVTVQRDPSQLDGLAAASRGTLETLIEREGVAKVASEDQLFLVIQDQGESNLIALRFDGEPDARHAEILEAFEEYKPLAATYASTQGNNRMTLLMRDIQGNESCVEFELSEHAVHELGPATEPPEASPVRQGLEHASARRGEA